MIKKFLSSILVVLHLVTFGHIGDARAANSPPQAVSVSPSSGTFNVNTPYTFTTVVSDPDGYLNINYCQFMINTNTVDGLRCPYVDYHRTENKLYIMSDTGSWIGGYAPGSANIIENSYSKLDCQASSVSGGGNNLTVNWKLTFKTPFTGNKNSYLIVGDNTWATSGWQQLGSASILGNPLEAVSTGEPLIGISQNAGYKASFGFLYIFQTNGPAQPQTIPNFSWKENESKPNALDLDDYFMSPDGLGLTYSVSGNNKINVAINTSTNKVSFSQPETWNGTETVKFTATDSEGNSKQSNPVSLQVEGVDNPPVLDFIPDITVNETELIKITPHATDLDNDPITYSFTAPLNANGQWQTDYTSAGTYTVTVTATDTTNLKDTQDVKIIVRNVNRPPVITKINGIAVPQGQPVNLPDINEGQTLQITPEATDADNETVSFSYRGTNSETIDTQGKWQINYDQAGNHTFIVTAFDGIVSVEQEVKVKVLNVNRPPQAALTLSKYTVAPNETFTITLTASDPDGDTMTYIIKKDNSEISSGSITDKITLDASFTGIGDHKISAIVKDSGSLETPKEISVDVYDPNANRDAINPVMGDFNGDALSDLGIHNSDTGTWEICLSDRGNFTAALDWLTGFGTSRDWWPMGGDFNADGRTDIGIYNNTTGELKIALSDGTKFINPQTALTFTNASYSWLPLTGNFNGDKYTDFAVYNKDSGEWRVSIGSSSGFESFTTWLNNFGGPDYSPLTGEFNGDGLTDIAIFKKNAGEFKIAFSSITTFIPTQNTWITNYAVDKDLILADFNGDGLTDVGYFDRDTAKWYYAINITTSFNDSGLWLENFGSSSDESGSTGDFNGDGITDAATFDKDQQGIYRWKVNVSTNKPTDLLVEIDNGIGGKTQVTYTYAAEYSNALLPFPVYVVSQISSIDTLPADQPIETYTQAFTYEGGWFDAAEREFRGFKKIKAVDSVTGNYTETYFYQGKPPQDGALKGQIEKIQAYDGDGKLISQAVNAWEVRKAGPTDGVLGFPYLKEVAQTVYEYGQTDPLSTKNQFAYDNLGNIVSEICCGDITVTGDEKSTETKYSAAYEQGYNKPTEISLKDKDGNLVNKKIFEYGQYGNLSKETAYMDGANAPSTQYAYDSFGNVTSTTNAEGHIVLTDYETEFYTYPEKITNELGHTIRYQYNTKFGVVTRLTDVNSNTTETAYDTYGRITQSKNTQGQIITTYSYPDFNTKVTSQGGQTPEGPVPLITKTEYIDGLGRKYKTISDGEDGTSKRRVSSEVYFNNRGLTDKESLPHYIDEDTAQIAYITYTYDKRGRVKSTTSDFPGVVKDATSYINYITPLYIETQDPRGIKKGTKKDVYGNIIEIIEFTQQGTYRTYYEYDLKGNLIKLTDSQGNITQIQYDTLGRKISLNDPDTGITTYTYDKLGNLTSQTDNKGQTIIMEYDALSRLVKKSSLSPEGGEGQGEGVVLATYEYDDASKPNCLGRLSKIRGQTPAAPVPVTTSYFYDSEGRAFKVDKTIDGQVYTTKTTYDLIGRTTSITYPDTEVVNYTYDTNSGLLESLRGTEGAEAISYVQDITYNAKGQIKTINYGNNTETTYTYGQDLRLSRILTRGQTPQAPVPEVLQDLNYDFDKNGNIIQIVNSLETDAYKIRTYRYDDLNRLTRATNIPHPTLGHGDFEYQYDPIGNMTYKSDVGFMTYPTTPFAVAQQGQMPCMPHAVRTAGSGNYVYDANGNMLSAHTPQQGTKYFTYDVENRMISLETSTETTLFTYDTDGSRIKKSSLRGTEGAEAISTTYISSLFEKDQDGKTTKHIFAGANRVCTITKGLSPQGTVPEVRYFHGDHLGSSNVITNEAGEQISFTEYTPYGTVATSTGTYNTPYKFTGKELDNTGLYFYAWRYYDPTIGRYCQPDTIIPEPYNPQTLNRYSYCDNNPLNYTDPSGHFKLGKWLGKIFGAIAGIITTVATGNPVLGFQVYSAISSIYDTGYALAHGADPLRTIGAFVAANILASVLPGGDTVYGNIFMQVGVNAARGAVIGATTAAIAGSDIGQGALWGGVVGGAVGFASSNQVSNFLEGKGFVSNAELSNGQLQQVADEQTSFQRKGTSDERRGSRTGQKQGGGKDPGKQPGLGPKKPEPLPKPGKQDPGHPPEVEDWIDGKRGVLPGPDWEGWDEPPEPLPGKLFFAPLTARPF